MIKNILMNIGIAIFVFIGGIYTYDTYLKSKHKEEIFYVVDVEKLYKSKQDGLRYLIENGATQKEINLYKDEYVSYVKDTEKYLSALSSKNNIVIFNKKAIFSKIRTVDLTKRIIDATK